MTRWNDIPYNEDTPAEEKAAQFDRQYAENGGNDEPVDTNPYSEENFDK